METKGLSEHTIEVLFRLAAGQDAATICRLAPHITLDDISTAATEALAVLTPGRFARADRPSSTEGHLRLVQKVRDPSLPTRPPVASHPRAGERWTDEEERDLWEGYRRGDGWKRLAPAFGRSRQALKARLMLMGVLDENATPTGKQPTFLDERGLR